MDDLLARGAKHLSCTSGSHLYAEPPVKMHGTLTVRTDARVGAFTEFGKGVEIQSARILRYCEIGPGCMLGARGHPTDWMSVNGFQYRPSAWGWHPAAAEAETIDSEQPGRRSFRGIRGETEAVIGNDVWLGANVVVLMGVTIGDGSIVAANAVVTKDIPPYSIAGGLPARVIRPRFDDDLAADLAAVRWWRYSPNQLSGVPFHEPARAVEEVRRRVEAGLEPYDPGFAEVRKAPRAVPAAAPAAPAPRWRRAVRRLRRR